MQMLNTAGNLICDPCESFLNDYLILVPSGFVKDRVRDFAIPALFVTVVTLNPVSGVTTGISMAVSTVIAHVSLRIVENFGKLLNDFRGGDPRKIHLRGKFLVGSCNFVGMCCLMEVMGSPQSIYRLLTTHVLYYGAVDVGEIGLKRFMLTIIGFLKSPKIENYVSKETRVSIIDLLLELPYIIDEEVSTELNGLKATLQIEAEAGEASTVYEALLQPTVPPVKAEESASLDAPKLNLRGSAPLELVGRSKSENNLADLCESSSKGPRQSSSGRYGNKPAKLRPSASESDVNSKRGKPAEPLRKSSGQCA